MEAHIHVPEAASLTPRPPVPSGLVPLLEALLRDRAGITARILSGDIPSELVPGLVAVSTAGAATYGATIGLQGGVLQAAASAAKLPLVLLGAAGLSLPLLHVACALAGRRYSFQQLSALVLQALATATVAMAGLAPIIAVWWMTVSMFGHGETSDWATYRRVVLAGLAVAGAGGLLGAARLLRTIPLRAAVPWTATFGLAALQLTWLLRPVVAMPDAPFALVRPLESNVVTEVLTALFAVLG